MSKYDKCSRCGFDYFYDSDEKNNGCKKEQYFKNGQFYNPIKVGDHGDFCEGKDENIRCYDCHAPIGKPHHQGCEAEKCPICGGQLITCGHFNDEYAERMEFALRDCFKILANRMILKEEVEKIKKKYSINF